MHKILYSIYIALSTVYGGDHNVNQRELLTQSGSAAIQLFVRYNDRLYPIQVSAEAVISDIIAESNRAIPDLVPNVNVMVSGKKYYNHQIMLSDIGIGPESLLEIVPCINETSYRKLLHFKFYA